MPQPGESIDFKQEFNINKPQPITNRRPDQPRMNDRIRISPVKVIAADGEMLGDMETAAALKLAVDAGLDLVEVAPDSRPPVCRIMDYGKVRFQRQKRSGGAKTHRIQLKTIRLRAKTGQHDIDVKVAQTRRFLCRGDKVKLVVIFRGRENAHHDRGREMLNEVLKTLEDMAIVEQFPRMESGRMMSAMIKPKPGLTRSLKDRPSGKQSGDNGDDHESEDDTDQENDVEATDESEVESAAE